jgi:SulP family sulfate permease
MAFTSSPNATIPLVRQATFSIKRYLPFVGWLRHYQRGDLTGDLMAGLIVAVMLVPQSMAYAMLAGLPPKVGLYASIAPLIIYGLLGSSRTLSVGPVAIDSLLVAAAIAPLALTGSPEYLQLALTLAFMVGLIELVMGFLRLGFLVNFLSQPVLVGFTNAAAVVIGFSQVKHLLGLSVPSTEKFYEQVLLVAQNVIQVNWVTAAISAISIAILLFFRNRLSGLLQRKGMSERWAMSLARSAPLVVVLIGTGLVWALQLNTSAGVKIVGEVPAGLPPLTLPSLDPAIWSSLLPAALAIAAVGYMEAISTAKSLARKRREKIDSDQELVAVGAANIGAAFTSAYPVTGGLSRSAVNFSSGANTGLASIITAGLIALTVLVLTPLFYYLPNAVLAAIIVVAVTNLFDWKTPRYVFRYSKSDSLSMVVTFLAVLLLGVANGIVVGAVASLVLFIWRTSRPHIAIVGRVGQSEHYRNVLRFQVTTWPEVVVLRIDESLYFGNAGALNDAIVAQVAENPHAKAIVLICSAINTIDVSALEMLTALLQDLQRQGIELHLTDVKGPVMDKLEMIGFVDLLGPQRIHLSAHEAMKALGYVI